MQRPDTTQTEGREGKGREGKGREYSTQKSGVAFLGDPRRPPAQTVHRYNKGLPCFVP